MGLYCLIFVLVPAVFSAAQTEEQGDATWYETEVPGFYASHADLPFGTRILVTNLNNNRQLELIIDNRIPQSAGRVLDISQEAAENLDMIDDLFTPISLVVLSDDSTLAGETPPPGAVVMPEPSRGPAPVPALPPVANVNVTVNVNNREQAAELDGDAAPAPALKPGGRTSRVQLASFVSLDRAKLYYDRLKAAGFSPAIERHGQYNRVIIPGVPVDEVDLLVRRLDTAGFHDPWIRQE
jgi:rare lipoprotein A